MSKIKNKKFVKIAAGLMVVLISFIIIETSMENVSIANIFSFFINKKKITLLSFIFLISIMTLLLGLSNNLILSLSFYLFSFIGLGIANSQKLQLRGEPVLPFDLLEIFSAWDLFKMMEGKQQIVSFAMLIIAVIGIAVIVRTSFYKSNKKVFENTVYRSLVLISSLGIIILFLNTNKRNMILRQKYLDYGFQEAVWSPMTTYGNNGFINSFVFNFPGQAMDKPESYNREKMTKIYSRLEKKALEMNITRINTFEDVSVVYILSESLSDPNFLSNIELSPNPLQYIQNDADKLKVGKMHVPAYGGGTANTEFEVLTSFNTSFLRPNMKMAYQNILSNYPNFQSIVSQIKSQGHETIAAHSFHSKFYKRRTVFKNLGFDRQVFDDDMSHTETLDNSNLISDASSYAEILDMLSNDANQFIHFITMQNHTPYHEFDENDFVFADGFEHEEKEQIINYAKSLQVTDVATEEFIKEIENLEKKVMIVFYGDHLPPLYNEIIEDQDLIKKFITDYFVYANFDVEGTSQDEIIPSYYVNNEVYNYLNIPLTPYHVLLEELNDRYIHISKNTVITKNLEVLNYEDLSQDDQQLIDEYELIQFDYISGKKYFWEFNDKFLEN